MSQQHLGCCQAAGRAPFHDEPTPSHPHSIAIAPQQSVSGLARFQSSRLRSRTRCMTTDNKFNAHRSFRHASDKFAPFLWTAPATTRADSFECRCLRAFAGKTMREIRRCYDARDSDDVAHPYAAPCAAGTISLAVTCVAFATTGIRSLPHTFSACNIRVRQIGDLAGIVNRLSTTV